MRSRMGTPPADFRLHEVSPVLRIASAATLGKHASDAAQEHTNVELSRRRLQPSQAVMLTAPRSMHARKARVCCCAQRCS